MPHPVDIHVGNIISCCRKRIGMTQQELAKSIGVKFQQIHKYETAHNRVSASKLFEIAAVLQEPTDYFFEGLVREPSIGDTPMDLPDLLSDKKALDLVALYYAIPESQRQKLMDLAKALAA
ncbi:helix-turn-helix domain-containing protein [Aliiroseovarius sp. S1339]|uniref:helix-turn-helix domain-containing protein n=1 Tax=Aliiroseovarius sp. S1339 TaxID=2936990 RepID=UPI0020BED9F2|nr:helix-turn-helix domain-containing protein [Aliiroseovarius sp. S1339]MCK8462812.1 helix-turn-helix domain-containing protein [Aliiroseovarius sp. S1339]